MLVNRSPVNLTILKSLSQLTNSFILQSTDCFVPRNDESNNFDLNIENFSNMQRGGTIYIMTNRLKTVLYTGVTSDLTSRIQEHKSKKYPNSFTTKYNVVYLVWYQSFSTIEEAIDKEKRIKAGRREQKCALINSMNPG